jgi:transmembrane sensor
VSPSERFWEGLRNEQDRLREQARYQANAKGRGPFRRRRRGHPGRWALVAAIPIVATAAISAALRHSRVAPRPALAFTARDGEVGQVGAWIAASPESSLPLSFSDGSRVVLSPGSRARVSDLDPNGARLVLERGGASASIVHRATSHWVVDVGPFETVVVGTRFDVNWDSNGEVFQLDLREGSVLVSGACIQQPRSIARGHRLRVSCKAAHEEILETRDEVDGSDAARPASSEAAATSEPVAADDVPVDTVGLHGSGRAPAASHEPPSSVPPSDAWRGLAAAGHYREALESAERNGFEEQCRRSAGADLLDLGDVARYAGSAKEARQAYLAARGKLPGGGRSAYGLGLTAFDQERDFTAAAQWFETYLAEQTEGDLRREAAGRAMEAWQRAGARDRARAAALEYLRQYPNGVQAPLARQLTMNH